jgi:hypothetical protein
MIQISLESIGFGGNVPIFLPDAWLDKKEVEIIKRAIKQKTFALIWMRAMTLFLSILLFVVVVVLTCFLMAPSFI